MRDYETKLTQERLKYLLFYNPISGDWTWLRPTAIRCAVGDTAGKIDSHGRRKIQIDGHGYNASRLAIFYVTGKWPINLIDHENGKNGDNSWLNLREATQKQNSANMKMRPNNTSGAKGVVKYKGAEGVKYRANITVDGHAQYLGSYETLEEAKQAYSDAAIKNWNEFARTE